MRLAQRPAEVLFPLGPPLSRPHKCNLVTSVLTRLGRSAVHYPSSSSLHEGLRFLRVERAGAMASSLAATMPAFLGCAAVEAAAFSASPRPAHTPLVSGFYGLRLTSIKEVRPRRVRMVAGKAFATAVDTSTQQYTLPTWAEFEMGRCPVYWETATGRPPASGQLLTIYYHPASSKLVPNSEFGVGFNGGFNQPIMCGGEPRIMTKKERGSHCEPFFAIKINVPVHAMSLEFSFTDGTSWDGPYKLTMEVHDKLKGMPMSYFNEGLAKELAREGACEDAIYPEAVYVQDRCVFPAGMIQQGGDRCELDIVPGCTDPESPFFDPLANVDDGSCPYISDGDE